MKIRLTKHQENILRLVRENCVEDNIAFYVKNYHYTLKDGTDIYLGMGNSGEFFWGYAKKSFESLVLKELLMRPNKDLERLYSITQYGIRYLDSR